MNLASFLDVRDILCAGPQASRNALFRMLVDRLVANHDELGDAAALTAAVLDREAADSTVLAPGVALPHARVDGIDRPYLAVATSRPGVVFVDGQPPVHAVILALIPKSSPALYLRILRALAGTTRAESENGALRNCASPEEILRIFQRDGLHLPDTVLAADILAPPAVTLKDNDSLKTAIDLFVDRQIVEIPVVDKEGDLVGVVSASALLHVCLPDYLLWMDDLKPIRNFEPFATVLRNEGNTWLGEILSEHYAFVQLDSPAIAVAAELSRQNTSLCYVLDNRRLMGTITLQRLLHKVFRE